MGKNNRAKWFKVHLQKVKIFLTFDDAMVGKGFKAAIKYFDTKEEKTVENDISDSVYFTLKEDADEATDSYSNSVKYGYRGSDKKYGRNDSEEREWI